MFRPCLSGYCPSTPLWQDCPLSLAPECVGTGDKWEAGVPVRYGQQLVHGSLRQKALWNVGKPNDADKLTEMANCALIGQPPRIKNPDGNRMRSLRDSYVRV